jgi:hypothetical protein
MRLFLACAIVLTMAIGIAGCFHKDRPAVQDSWEPLKVGERR